MKKNKFFILLSIAIFCFDIIFIFINYHYNKSTLQQHLQEQSESLYTVFNTELESTYENLLLIATLYAADQHIQKLLMEAKIALEKEGGGRGGEQSAGIRQQLLDHTLDGWNKATKHFNVRQLHFHLGPENTSFLRVHKPDKFGDKVNDIRFTIVDTHKEQMQRSGFETGRVYSGLRGVVPVFSPADKNSAREFIGTLEVGTAFTSILKHIDTNFDVGIAVLLKQSHLKKYMWPDFFAERFSDGLQICNCFIEASSRSGVKEIIEHTKFNTDVLTLDTKLKFMKIGDKYYFLSFYPFNDYVGKQTGLHDFVGSILIWKDVTALYSRYLNKQKINIFYGLLTFLIIEMLLFSSFKLSTLYFNKKIAIQDKTLDEKEKFLKTITLKNKQLLEARNIAEKANQAKSEFLASMSHELRTPLNSIIGYAQLFKYDKDLAQIHKNNSEQINDAGQHLLLLINDLLDLSKIEADQIVINMSEVHLVPLIKECQILVEPILLKKGMNIDCQLAHCNHIVQADEIRLKQSLLNLMSNAIKYTDSQGNIKVFCSTNKQGKIKLGVSDTGHGISEKNQQKLFRAFNRLGEENSNIQGTGIGLVISKKLIEMMDGTIEFNSKEGEGSTFWIVLNNANSTTTGTTYSYEQTTQKQPSPLASNEENHQNTTAYSILYIEDNQSNLLLMESVFSTRPELKLLNAASGEIGIKQAIEHKPDVILMDINLPDIDGYETARRLALNTETCTIPIIALTANAMNSDISKSIQAGFASHISKPFNIQELFNIINTVILSRVK